jgi:hypothetical protein
MTNIERYVLHYRMVNITRLQAFDYEKKNRDLRIDYLLNKIEPDVMKVMFQRAEKKTMKDAEMREVYQIVCNTGEDVIFRFYAYIEELSVNSVMMIYVILISAKYKNLLLKIILIIWELHIKTLHILFQLIFF